MISLTLLQQVFNAPTDDAQDDLDARMRVERLSDEVPTEVALALSQWSDARRRSWEQAQPYWERAHAWLVHDDPALAGRPLRHGP